MAEGPYSRIYWEVMDDPKFDGIREDVRHFGSWSLMLVVADMAYPAPAFLPPVPPGSVKALVQHGLVELLPGGRFRICALAKERDGRSERARASVAHRYNDRSTAVVRPKNARTSADLLDEDEKRQRRGREDARVVDDEFPERETIAWLARHGCALSETSGLRRKLILLVERFDSGSVVASFERLSAAGVMDGDARGFVFGAEEELFPKPRKTAAFTDETPEDREASKRRAAQTLRDLEEERARRERLLAEPVKPLGELLPRPSA